VVRALTVPGYGWQSHPAVLMWRGHLEALGRYGLVVVDEWVARGFGDTCAATIRHDLAEVGVHRVRTQAELAAAVALPSWLGDEAVHLNHRSALLRKDPDWYRPRFPGVPDDLPYAWPVRSAKAVGAEGKRSARSRPGADRAAPVNAPDRRAPDLEPYRRSGPSAG
jgi:pyrimidine dimer DNA glycosylase